MNMKKTDFKIDDKVEFIIDCEYFTGVIIEITNEVANVSTYMGIIENIPIIELKHYKNEN